MVGTRPIERPADRHRREASSIAPGAWITTGRMFGRASAAVPDLFAILRGRGSVVRVLMLRSRKLPGPDYIGVGRLSTDDVLGEVRVPLNELLRLTVVQADHVVQYQDLP